MFKRIFELIFPPKKPNPVTVYPSVTCAVPITEDWWYTGKSRPYIVKENKTHRIMGVEIEKVDMNSDSVVWDREYYRGLFTTVSKETQVTEKDSP